MNRLINFSNLKWVCHHLHIDKSKSIDVNILKQSEVHMKSKWELMQNIKKNYIEKDVKKKMLATTTQLYNQGCSQMRTFIDVDNIVGLKLLHCALDLKRYWKPYNVDLQIGTQLLNGLDNPEDLSLFYQASELVDFIGCLPSRDINPNKHLEIVFNRALELNKPVEAHLDQCNIPSEKETELFCDFVQKYNYEGKARAIHCISLACHPTDYQKKIAQRLHNLDIGVIVCPSAAISMTQHSEFNAPIHNSIAPVTTLLKEGVNVGLGVDNVEDIFMPFCDGDLIFELRLLAESARIYKPDVLESIASNNMGFT
tara:strand:- start:982 stop:1917 length:936 start_codon:yes stop_codon:yes gene_type:complete